MNELRKELVILRELNLKPNYAELARKYNCDYRTVKKYNLGYQGKSKTRFRPSKLQKYQEEIKEKINKTGATKKAVYEYLKEKYSDIGHYSNFSYFIRKNNLKEEKVSNKPHPRYETPFGKQLQFDWKEEMKMTNKYGEIFEFNILTATLSTSRFHNFIYSKTKTREDVERSLIKVFERMQGVPEEILTDNMSSIVNHTTHKFNKEFLAFCKDLQIKPKHCKVRSPETKGKVESANRFMSWLIPYNNEFETEEELIKIIDAINKKVNQEINDTTGVAPLLLYEKEKEYLKPLPNKELLERYKEDTQISKVPNTFLVNYKGSQYSVPPKFINKTVKLKEFNNKLNIYYNEEIIACHEICNKKINYNEQHYRQGMAYWLEHCSVEDINKTVENNLKELEKLNKGGRL